MCILFVIGNIIRLVCVVPLHFSMRISHALSSHKVSKRLLRKSD